MKVLAVPLSIVARFASPRALHAALAFDQLSLVVTTKKQFPSPSASKSAMLQPVVPVVD